MLTSSSVQKSSSFLLYFFQTLNSSGVFQRIFFMPIIIPLILHFYLRGAVTPIFCGNTVLLGSLPILQMVEKYGISMNDNRLGKHQIMREKVSRCHLLHHKIHTEEAWYIAVRNRRIIIESMTRLLTL
jgi:hypothetical protein